MAVKTTLILALSLAILCEVTAIATSIRQARFPVGGLFNNRALKYSRQAFETVGISRGTSSSKNYNGRIIYPSVRDSYSVALEVCKNTSNDNGIVALVDARPTDGMCDTVCLLCNRYNISHLTIGWEPTETMSQDLFTFAFYPPADIISKAYATLIRDLAWDKFTIFYEDDGSFIRLQEIIGTWPHTKEPIRYRKLNPVGDNRETFKEVFKVSRMSHHVMDCDAKNILKYMREILQVENSTQYQSFILTNLDAHTVDLKQVPNLVANVSTMFMGNPDDPRWKDIGIDPGPGIQMETALAVDALNHLEKAIRKMQMDQENDGLSKQDYGIPPNLCFKDSKAEYTPWECGEKLRQALLEVETKGFTGKIKFDSEGKRTDFDMHYYKLNNESKFVQAGSWNSTTNIITKEETVPDRSMTQTSGVIRVISKRGLPYFDVKIDEDGKEIPRGYAVDLVTDIFKIINKEQGTNFTLKFWEVPDKLYGSPIEGTRKWNGIIGELMEHRADLAVCDLSITSERNAVVDFSTPFMSTGISMLFRERDPVDPDMFSFINPLSLDVWLYLATTYIIVSFILLICARMSQDDWVNPHPCNQNPESLQNIWSLYNCMWLTMGSIMTQGCDILPRGLGSRWTAGIWYFFAMIVTASYTANMSTFLSNSRRSNDITDVKQLSEQNKVSYGAVTNASTYKFFENSNDTVHQKIWQVMSTTKPTVFTSSNDEGKERVLRSKGNYAFFMESTAIKYYTERDCMLRMVGPPLDSKAYGVAMPKNFPHKGLVDRAILKLQESNRLAELQKKWWKEEDNNNKNCENVEEEDDSGSLQMKNTSGIFLVLGVGGILGLIVAIIDFLLHARKIAVKERVTWKEALASEWRASLNPRTLAKPAAPPRSAAPSSGSPSPQRERSRSRAVSVLHAASSFINFDDIY